MAKKVNRKNLFLLGFIFFSTLCTIILVYFFKFEAFKQSKHTEDIILKFTNYIFQIAGKNTSGTKKEYCIDCHKISSEFSNFHNPNVIGCTSCHLGNPKTLVKSEAHKGIVVLSGNLSVVHNTCGKSECHSDIVDRISKSLMNTMSGVIAVDKFVFGKIANPDGKFKVTEISHSAADVHLRNLCVSCHIGKEKTELGEITQLSRGGGCSACHLLYDSLAEKELKLYKKNKNFAPRYHPKISIEVASIHCFGCHSRSGRISTNFIGLMETTLNAIPKSENEKFVKLEDGRIFFKVSPDVHHQKGITCVDCHTSREIMGDGYIYTHKEQQIEISCIDCHPDKTPRTVSFDSLDAETKKIIGIRGLTSLQNDRFVIINKSNRGYSNVILRDNKIILLSKSKSLSWASPFQSEKCIEQRNMHPTMTCIACHTQWVPRCISCHTTYMPDAIGWDNVKDTETTGAWIEHGDIFYAGNPTLGNVFEKGQKSVTTFMPGMILKIDGANFPGKSFVKSDRLYAPTFSHKISKSTKQCKDCHLNPVYLGFGEGELRLIVRRNRSEFVFLLTYNKNSVDGLPLDAWIDFKRLNKGKASRSNASSLTAEQIKRVLNIGSCFACHNWKQNQALEILKGDYKKRITKKCLLPY